MNEEKYKQYTICQAKYFHSKFIDDIEPNVSDKFIRSVNSPSENFDAQKSIFDDKKIVNNTTEHEEAVLQLDEPTSKRIRNTSNASFEDL